MADLLQMSVSGYARIERGETGLSLSRIEQIASIFEIPASEILNIGNSYMFTNHGPNSGNTFYGNVNVANEKRLDQVEQQLAELRALVAQFRKS
jgi:transcriptional regulator with XRE-family HTH domain